MRAIFEKIDHKLMHLRLQPIRVFCFHQVSEQFDPSTMWECDWTQIDQFKQNIMHLKEQYTFISMEEAYHKLTHDKIRYKKYAVLTADDGWASLKNIIPWLAERNIPITLFINPLYLDGIHKQEREAELLLTKVELEEIIQAYPNVSIGSHGWSHIDTTKLNTDEFIENVIKSEQILKSYKNKIPFYAFTYGRYRTEFLSCLKDNHLVPVLIDGMVNIKFDGVIHRERIDNIV